MKKWASIAGTPGDRDQTDERKKHQTPGRPAIAYAIEHRLPSVTLMHKGNIMKFTEGAFSKWGYQVAREKFGEHDHH